MRAALVSFVLASACSRVATDPPPNLAPASESIQWDRGGIETKAHAEMSPPGPVLLAQRASVPQGFARDGAAGLPRDARLDAPGAGRRAGMDPTTEAYDHVVDNAFLRVGEAPLSTFSIDVDTASYANVRRILREGRLPPTGAVRIEEMVNAFRYAYPEPAPGKAFSVTTEVVRCPWQERHLLLRVGLRGKTFPERLRPPCTLVFLLDVSGSMDEPAKLPLVQRAMQRLVAGLRPQDRVAIVTYAGTSGLVLPATSGSEAARIQAAIAELRPGGSTNGAMGIQLAYRIAREHFQNEGVNRVILATDGDFNVGVTSQSELAQLIEEERRSGVFLTVLGVGAGNLKDSTMEKLAHHGNGNYAYLDSDREAERVLVEEVGGTLHTIAKDVKLQIEFNPRHVQAYRLIGYENRVLAAQDFTDDRKDAGDLGAGHTVTALYELVPAGVASPVPAPAALRYRDPGAETPAAAGGELLTLALRAKQPDGATSSEEVHVCRAPAATLAAEGDTAFAAAVAAFGMELRRSPHKGSTSLALVRDLVRRAGALDPAGYRAEFLELVDRAAALAEPVASAGAGR
ncbi:MAG: VWA domain-containing protein [Planctomycetes bacterium]|nr:VWA domain-containing protein [Planctomycetota bacterium]